MSGWQARRYRRSVPAPFPKFLPRRLRRELTETSKETQRAPKTGATPPNHGTLKYLSHYTVISVRLDTRVFRCARKCPTGNIPSWQQAAAFKPMPAQTEYVTLSVADGTSMQAYISRPAATPRGGLIVFQEAFGVNPHIRGVADRFASEGYLCIAP